uniref:Inositol-1-monophosphatase n=2 Tax=Agrobacterium deltaense TaxID=1183412 RepID=A0A2Z2PNI8_9HYPH|nr:arabinose phosphate phosphatase [Agrobacterium deltaense]
MPKSAEQDTAAIVEKIARKAGERALDHFRSLSSLPVETKGHLDLVTEADKDVEAFLIGSLREAFPDDGIMGEESGEIAGTSGRVWVIDPIDGTFNFVRGGQNWAISIGLYENRRPSFGVIYAPVRDLILVGGKTVPTRLNGQPIKPLPALDMSRASTGFSRFISDDLKISFRFCGAATLSMIEVAMGETDGYVSLGDLTWDVMAALPILGHLGISNTIDWEDRIDLSSKLRFACGSEEFLSKVRPLIEKVSAAA